jgi:hypothetical protein
VRLAELDPTWIATGEGRRGMGVMFLCPHCRDTYVGGFFANPLDGGPPAGPEHTPRPRWQRSGDTFETLTITPSIDASASGHWHGFVTNGEVT